ncbi:MAG: electron transfer flavoprotein subunit alpha/FixB family protein [Bacillota bacterium]|nr:electron transfer flavoprotein subunit alpha/FixB family protein [Bacillota bacterium]
MAGIMIVAEYIGDKVRGTSFELVSEGKKIADAIGEEVIAVLFGNGLDPLAASLAQYGADKVLLVESDKLAAYTTGAFSKALTEVVKEVDPNIVLFGNSVMAKDLAPRVAMRLGVGLATDCTNMEMKAGKVYFTRPIYAGKAFAKVSSDATPVMATIRPNSFTCGEPDSSKNAVVEKKNVTIEDVDLRTVIKETLKQASGRVELTEANIIVSGGRGIKGPEGFKVLEELADVVGAAVGASRAAVDSGWCSHQMQVGQTGKVVSPTLYIACGISGAIQHLAGMGSSKCIVAVNKDPEANIFNVADYGIVGDLFEIVPLLKEEFTQILGGSQESA